MRKSIWEPDVHNDTQLAKLNAIWFDYTMHMYKHKAISYSCFLAAVTRFWYMLLVHCSQGENSPHKYICILLFFPFQGWRMCEMNSKSKVMKWFKDEVIQREWEGMERCEEFQHPRNQTCVCLFKVIMIRVLIAEASNIKARLDKIENH